MKSRRQGAILEIVDREPLHSQEQLRRRLRRAGFEATQATISRDIKELGLMKRAGDGAYQRPGEMQGNPETALNALAHASAEFVRRVDRVQQMLVIRTGAGQAQALALAIDRCAVPGNGRHHRRRRHDPRHREGRSPSRVAGQTARGPRRHLMRIVLAYTGSLEGSVAIPWLRERHHAEIVAVTLDLGQGRALEAIRDRALALGAQRAHVLDTREVFARDFIVPALRADALHDGRVPMALALSRPLIAQKLVEIAGIERARRRGSHGAGRWRIVTAGSIARGARADAAGRHASADVDDR